MVSSENHGCSATGAPEDSMMLRATSVLEDSCTHPTSKLGALAAGSWPSQ